MARGAAQPGHHSVQPTARHGGDDVQIEAPGASHVARLDMNGSVDYQTKVYQTVLTPALALYLLAQPFQK
jgi:hypothetical protein